jgi:O-methyltransferase involved in polyketide biosynthesis
MEGVSPYIDDVSFGRFLSLLSGRLAAGSQVAYDFKIRGVQDDLFREGRTQRPFRLPTANSDVAAFHEACGLQLEHLELSCELCARLLPGEKSAVSPFTEDALVRLRRGATPPLDHSARKAARPVHVNGASQQQRSTAAR